MRMTPMAASAAAAGAATAVAAARAASAAIAALSKMKLVVPPLWQQKMIVEWLEEWTQELALRKQDAAAESRASPPIATGKPSPSVNIPCDLVQPYDRESIQAGQIRLLAPHVLPTVDRPVYIAVLTDPQANRCLLAPFSPFSVPAVPSELMTKRDEMFLRVLCLWNYRSVPVEIVGKSWIYDECDSPLLSDAWDVLHWFAAKVRLPKRLTQRVGPPLSHPLDPRHDYLHETNLDDALAATEGTKPFLPSPPKKPSRRDLWNPQQPAVPPRPKGFYFSPTKPAGQKPKK